VIYYDKGTQVSKTVVFDTGLECLTKATELLLIGFLRSSRLQAGVGIWLRQLYTLALSVPPARFKASLETFVVRTSSARA
jgi:hypothetical protein